MSGSYKDINYAIRPAKSIERKMLCETFRRLSVICPVEKYRYIGFGSAYFSDFYLFHKALNFYSMHSIERDTNNSKRFEFNCPFKCIQIHFGESNAILPTLEWNNLSTIVWLDYDGNLNQNVLADIKTVCSNVSPGSVIIISVNAHPSGEASTRLDALKKLVGEERVSPSILEKDLAQWGTAKVLRSIINNEIQETLTDRNGGLQKPAKITYQQLLNFHYADGAKMLTVGGILYSQEQKDKVDNCYFDQLPFVRTQEEEYLIKVPNLTYRELRYLDTQLPVSDISTVSLPGVSSKDIENYSNIYRYFPMFAETDV
ncbi:O-methyltransferase [Nostoc sp.]|uniref:O-methyltransferase n=1 Tax=Nostoc sp. TaxID=1180 RepID=UPI002FFAC51F